MKRVAVCVISSAGLAVGAAADTFSVHVSFDKTVVSVGETFEATMVASWTGFEPGTYLSTINIDVFGSQNWAASNVSAIAWNNPLMGFSGLATASGADVLGIDAGQFSLLGPVIDSNPLLILTWTVTVSEASGPEFTYTPGLSGGAPYPFSLLGPDFSDPPAIGAFTAFSSDTAYVPVPWSWSVLGWAALLGGRRVRGAAASARRGGLSPAW